MFGITKEKNYYENYFIDEGLKRDIGVRPWDKLLFLVEGKKTKVLRDQYGKTYSVVNTGLQNINYDDLWRFGKYSSNKKRVLLSTGEIFVNSDPFSKANFKQVENAREVDFSYRYRSVEERKWVGIKKVEGANQGGTVPFFKQEKNGFFYILDSYYKSNNLLQKGNFFLDLKWLFNDKLLLENKLSSLMQFYDFHDQELFFRFFYLIPGYKNKRRQQLLYKCIDAKIYCKSEALLLFFPLWEVYTLYFRKKKRKVNDVVVRGLFFRLFNVVVTVFKYYNIFLFNVSLDVNQLMIGRFKFICRVVIGYVRQALFDGYKYRRGFPFGIKKHRKYMRFMWFIYVFVVCSCNKYLFLVGRFGSINGVQWAYFVVRYLIFGNSVNKLIEFVNRKYNKQAELLDYVKTWQEKCVGQERKFLFDKRVVHGSRIPFFNLGLYDYVAEQNEFVRRRMMMRYFKLFGSLKYNLWRHYYIMLQNKYRRKQALFWFIRKREYFHGNRKKLGTNVKRYIYYYHKYRNNSYFMNCRGSITFYSKYHRHPFYEKLISDPGFYLCYEGLVSKGKYSYQLFKKNMRNFLRLAEIDKHVIGEFSKKFIEFLKMRYGVIIGMKVKKKQDKIGKKNFFKQKSFRARRYIMT